MTPPTPGTEDEFEPPSPGSWGWHSLAEANHESAHALAVHVLGLKVLEVRIDKPMNRGTRGIDPLGRCEYEKVRDDQRWKAMLVALAPSVMSGTCPERPPRLDNAERGDMFNAAVIIYEEEIDDVLYGGYCALLDNLVSTPLARKKGLALGTALLERGALRGSEVEALFAEVEAEAGDGKASDDGEDADNLEPKSP